MHRLMHKVPNNITGQHSAEYCWLTGSLMPECAGTYSIVSKQEDGPRNDCTRAQKLMS